MRLKKWYVYVNMFIIAIGTLVFGYWYFIDGVWNPIIKIQSNPMAIETTQRYYHRGDVIYINFAFCKLRNIPAVTNWRLVDGEIILLPPITKQVKLGCYGVDKPYVTAIAKIPMNITPGVWFLEGETSFSVNPVKTDILQRKTITFEILP
jgi:hypothetical protein